jgi:multicomponent Na+:H+ antiporter subunit E
VLHAVSLAFALSILWLLLSGYFTEPLLLALGLASVLLVVIIVHRMEVLDPEGHPVHLGPRALLYWPWLIKEILLANIDVGKAILRFRGAAAVPTVFTVRASQRSDLGRVIYANSITLTPGTVSVDIEDDTILVHAITEDGARDVASGGMDRMVKRFEGDER